MKLLFRGAFHAWIVIDGGKTNFTNAPFLSTSISPSVFHIWVFSVPAGCPGCAWLSMWDLRSQQKDNLCRIAHLKHLKHLNFYAKCTWIATFPAKYANASLSPHWPVLVEWTRLVAQDLYIKFVSEEHNNGWSSRERHLPLPIGIYQRYYHVL